MMTPSSSLDSLLSVVRRMPLRLAIALLCGMGCLSGGWLRAQSTSTDVVVPVTVEAAPVEAPPAASQPLSVEPPVTEVPSQAIAPAEPEPLTIVRETPQADNYIDPTRYSVGATDYDGPDKVVVSERSSGCETAVGSGQGFGSGWCRTAAPSWQPGTSGARTAQWENPSYGAPSHVNVWGFAPGTSTAASRDYYNRTIRPLGRLGNNNLGLIFPLSLPAPITSVFGWRIHPITGDSRFHSGTDLGAPMGTPVLAAYAGQVALADFLGGYGLAVVLDHQATKPGQPQTETLYGHLSEIFVKPGETVAQGAVIGRVGSTGNSTGPHLHFELRQMTPEGWVAMDAGSQLEYAMAQLIQALQTAQTPTQPKS